MSKKKGGRTNYGIQAKNVTAGAMAVGEGATATQTIASGVDSVMLAAAIADLKAAIEASALAPEAKAVLNEDLEVIAVESEKPDIDKDGIGSALENLVTKIKLAGQLTQGAADLIEPVKKIASAVGLGAAVLGLL